MLRETLESNVLIVGSGIAGLSLGYFLKRDFLIVSLKIGKKDTGLVSNKILDFIPFPKKLIIEKYREAVFENNKKEFYVRAKRGYMLLINREKLDKYLYEKIKDNVILGETIKNINKKKKVVYTKNYKIKYNFLIDATGAYSYLRKIYGIPTNLSFVQAFEGHFESDDKELRIILDISKKYFGWIIKNSKISKVGIIDEKIKYEDFIRFLKIRKIKIKNYYSAIIKNKQEKILSTKYFASIGESTGYVKPFSLGGIIFSIVQSKILSEIIKKNYDLRIYNFIIRKIFREAIVYHNIIRFLLKSNFTFSLIKILKLYKLAGNLDLDFYTLTQNDLIELLNSLLQSYLK